MAPRKGFIIEFAPSGVRLLCEEPITALQAACRARLALGAECGGRGRCGKCRVRVVSGAVPVPGAADRTVLPEPRLEEGWRLACQLVLREPCTVSVPAAAAAGAPIIQADGGTEGWRAMPTVRAVPLAVPPPSLTDPASDLLRVERLLGETLPGRETSISRAALAALPRALREGEGPLWVVLRGQRIVSARRGSEPPLLGLAVDVGTTKLACYLVELETGATIAAKGVANPQIADGEDVMSRLEAALSRGRAGPLQRQVIEEINAAAAELCAARGRGPGDIVELCLVGNTAMHHLLLGLPTDQLAVSPFVPAVSRSLDVEAAELGLAAAPGAVAHFPAPIAGFVGSDHLAFLLSCGFGTDGSIHLGIDIGTNTEIALQAGGKIASCSTASGPAFEGAEIRQGMRAEPGAIEHLSMDAGGAMEASVIGGGPARGICGSGILDALSVMRTAGIVDQRGRLHAGRPGVSPGKSGGLEYVVAPNADGSGVISLGQDDIDQVLLAKGAIRAGIGILLERAGLSAADISRVSVAGAFGCSLDPGSAMRIGMFPQVPVERIRFAGNAAGQGARMMLASTEERARAALLARRVEYVELAAYPRFHAHFAQGIRLPEQRAESALDHS